MSIHLFKEKAVEVVAGDPGWCPKRKGGRRYQAEVLQEMCRKCKAKRKYCPEKLKKGGRKHDVQ